MDRPRARDADNRIWRHMRHTALKRHDIERYGETYGNGAHSLSLYAACRAPRPRLALPPGSAHEQRAAEAAWDDMETGGATRQKARLEGGLDMKRIFWTLATIAALATTAAAAADTSSANFMLPFCKSLLARHVVEDFQQGHCAGLIEGLAFLARRANPPHRSCRPDGVTTGQVVRTIVRWLKQRPRRWHENFKYLALEAMHETWPCK